MKRQRFVGVVAGLAATAGVVLGGASTAVAKGGEVGGTGDQYFLSNTLAATSNIHLSYGRSSDQVYIGDWDGDG
ncbi:hypothetical protein PU560_01520, partial [Georgenia sp. 10Sc9-8]|nr:hypothetical protein [Georgenia halotolerans]